MGNRKIVLVEFGIISLTFGVFDEETVVTALVVVQNDDDRLPHNSVFVACSDRNGMERKNGK